jgi:hypothetical protein
MTKSSPCELLSRRGFLRLGGLGLGLGLAGWPRAHASASERRSVILICLPGGPSHIDMYDMKPDAPAEIRGEFKPIQTVVPGFDLCEHMPLQARIADQLAVVRNLRFIQGDHQLHEVFTGFPAGPASGFMSPPVKPAFGAIVSRLRQNPAELLPRYVTLGGEDHPRTVKVSEDPLFLGSSHRPFEPSPAMFDSMTLRPEVSQEQFADRRQLLRTFDGLQRGLDADGSLDGLQRKALDMLTSDRVRDAFDLAQEPERVRDLYGPDVKLKQVYQYGHTWFGGKFLQARRLAEAGVPVITLAMGGWDDHGPVNAASPKGTVFERLREKLPLYDRSIYALATDLRQRGLDRQVAVVVWGEFGRTPKVNFAGGRDHWTSAGFALCFVGGFRTGQLIGRTDAQGQRPVNKAYTPQNVFATLYRHLGIDPDLSTYQDPSGRPIHLLEDSAPIEEL